MKSSKVCNKKPPLVIHIQCFRKQPDSHGLSIETLGVAFDYVIITNF